VKQLTSPQPRKVQQVYLTLVLLNTLAASFIWGINTLFLLDAGLSATAAFAANAFWTVGQVLFEVPTGVVADTWGRRTSYLLGALTLAAATALYWVAWEMQAPFWAWAATSALLGLGYTFFSGATEAWLVDALKHTGFEGSLDSVFSKAQIVGGAAMLSGSVAGGLIAQWTNLGVPYLLRSAALVVTLVVAFVSMRDWGFAPARGKGPVDEMRHVFTSSLRHGFGNPPVRWMMLSSPFLFGVVAFAGYATQPYLLRLYGDERAYSIAGLAAAIIAGAQIAGGMASARIRRLFRRRTSALLTGALVSTGALALLGVTTSFWVAVALLVVWGLLFAATLPIRQAYLNGLIPSEQRATVLSFDNLLGSSGGVVIQPSLGRVADAWSYSTSYLVGAAINLLAVPLMVRARQERASSDAIHEVPGAVTAAPAPAPEPEPAEAMASREIA
jgi:MFS family permease